MMPRALFFLLLFSPAFANPTEPDSTVAVAAATSDDSGLRDLNRKLDPVIMTGDQLGAINGVHKDKVRLFASENGHFRPVPYQVDERLDDGEFAYDHGEMASEDADQGLVDDNDEFVFLAEDAGDRVPRTGWPHDFEQGIEITVTDPIDGGQAWAYLFSFENPPDPSPVDYVRGIVHDNNVYYMDARDYHINNAKFPPNTFRPTHLYIRDDPWGGEAPNLIDATKLRTKINYKFITIHKKETEFRTDLVGSIDGPVRIVNRNALKMYLFLGIWLPSPVSMSFMYPWGYSVPNKVKLPVTANDNGKSNIRVAFDHNPNLLGHRFYSDRNPESVLVDGLTDEQEEAMDRSYPKWIAMMGEEGGMVSRLRLHPDLSGQNRLHYSDDASVDDSPDFHPGQWGEFGFIIDVSGIPKGVYDIDYNVFFKRHFEQGDEVEFLQILDAPVTAVAGPGTA